MYGKTGKNCPMYGKHHTAESRKIMSEKQKGKYNSRAKYTLWDSGSVYYRKSRMPAEIKNDKDIPKCFSLKYNGKYVKCGSFGDFITPQIIAELIKEEGDIK